MTRIGCRGTPRHCRLGTSACAQAAQAALAFVALTGRGKTKTGLLRGLRGVPQGRLSSSGPGMLRPLPPPGPLGPWSSALPVLPILAGTATILNYLLSAKTCSSRQLVADAARRRAEPPGPRLGHGSLTGADMHDAGTRHRTRTMPCSRRIFQCLPLSGPHYAPCAPLTSLRRATQSALPRPLTRVWYRRPPARRAFPPSRRRTSSSVWPPWAIRGDERPCPAPRATRTDASISAVFLIPRAPLRVFLLGPVSFPAMAMRAMISSF